MKSVLRKYIKMFSNYICLSWYTYIYMYNKILKMWCNAAVGFYCILTLAIFLKYIKYLIESASFTFWCLYICKSTCNICFQTVLRIWDCLFYEGSKILFRVGVTLIKKHREQLLACRNFPEIIQTLKQITSDTTVLQCHEFVEVKLLMFCLIIVAKYFVHTHYCAHILFYSFKHAQYLGLCMHAGIHSH